MLITSVLFLLVASPVFAQLDLDNAGNVGIGTTSPSPIVEIATAISLIGFISTECCSEWLRRPGWKITSIPISFDTALPPGIGRNCKMWMPHKVNSVTRGMIRPDDIFTGLWKDGFKWSRQWIKLAHVTFAFGMRDPLPSKRLPIIVLGVIRSGHFRF